MNKLFLKIATLTAGVAMAIGVGVGLSSHKGAKSVSAEASYSFGEDTVNFQNQGCDNGVQYTGTFTNGEFEVSFAGGSNDGKYYDTGSGIRTYGGGRIAISVVSGFKMTSATLTFHTTSYVPSSTDVLSGDGSISIDGRVVTWTGNSTSGFTLTRPSGSGHWRLQSVKGVTSVSTAPTVSIDNAPGSHLSIGDKGTLTASALNATEPITFSWESDDASVVAITDGGAFEAKGAGKTKIRVNMTCTEGNASAEADVIVDAGLITIAEANEIASHLTSGSTTPYKVTVEGFLTNFNADSQTSGKERALTLSTAKVGETGSALMVFGVYSSAEIRNYGILNATARWTGNLQNYNSTYELTSPQLVSYTDEAIQYATAAYSYLDETCVDGAEAVTDQQWNKLAGDFEDIDEYAKAKLAAVSSSYAYNEAIKNWIGRYEIIVASGKSNFMNNTTVSSNIVSNNDTNDNVVPMVLIVVVSVAFGMGAMWIVLRKKRLSK